MEKVNGIEQLEQRQKQLLEEKEKEKAGLLIEIQRLKAPVETKDDGAFEEGACALLSLLQNEARFVDFVQESLEGLDDEKVGSVSRQIHKELVNTFGRYIKVEPVFDGEEGKKIKVAESAFAPSRIRLCGNVDVKPPFEGILLHRGWAVSHINLPKKGGTDGLRILQPAEVETK
jgi:hypothetical protein